MTRLEDSVVVVTGASSGLGRAIALELAHRGSALALGARSADGLEDTARGCRAAGSETIVVPTDVTHEDEVDRLAEAALARWGRIDVWINNAAVTMFALLEQGPFEPHQRVIETNLFGAVFGARAVLPVFRRQHRGVLINIGSMLGEVGQAFVPSYVISKFGVRGLSEALRVEVADEPDIHVCTVLPYAIDTPHFEVAANELGRAPYAMPPVQTPERIARAIAEVVEHPRRVRHLPRIAVLGLVFHALAPRLAERLLLEALRRWHLSDQPQHSATGNLFVPARRPPATHGTRPPQLGTGRLLLWLAGTALRIQADALVRSALRTLVWLGRPREV